MNRLLLVTDAWSPQVNGVARNMQEMRRHAIQQGIHVRVLHPGRFHTFPCPTEASLRLSSFPYRRMLAHFERFRPDAVHLATEGPLGLSARRICLQKEKGFTTSFCTHFPEYLRERVGIPATWTWKGVHWFHRQASRVFAATKPLQRELERQNFPNVALVPRGVDTSQFHPEAAQNIQQAGLPGSLPRPWFLSVGRVAQEKNLVDIQDAVVRGQLRTGEGVAAKVGGKSCRATWREVAVEEVGRSARERGVVASIDVTADFHQSGPSVFTRSLLQSSQLTCGDVELIETHAVGPGVNRAEAFRLDVFVPHQVALNRVAIDRRAELTADHGETRNGFRGVLEEQTIQGDVFAIEAIAEVDVRAARIVGVTRGHTSAHEQLRVEAVVRSETEAQTLPMTVLGTRSVVIKLGAEASVALKAPFAIALGGGWSGSEQS